MRLRSKRALLLGSATVGAVAVVVFFFFFQGPVRRAVVRAAAHPARLLRSPSVDDTPAPSALIASRVGFLSHGPKRFTSPTPFTSVAVVDANSGSRLWESDEPPRMLPSASIPPSPAVWVGDVSAFDRPGRYRLVADNGLASAPFEIGDAVYDDVVRAVQRVLFYQRAFTAILPEHAEGPWSHASDAALAPSGVVGGWHDAGDYTIYNMTSVSTLFWLLKAHQDFRPDSDSTGIPESGNGVPDILDEARWGLSWLLSVQGDDGAFPNTTCHTVYGAYGAYPPDRAGPYVHGEFGAVPTARAVGILAWAATHFAPYDSGFARRLEEAARRGWRYLEPRPDDHSDGALCDAYRQDGDPVVGRSVRAFAAAGLFAASSDPVFRAAFDTWFTLTEHEPSPFRVLPYAAMIYRASPGADPIRIQEIDALFSATAKRYGAEADASPYGFSGRYAWGSIPIAFDRASLLVRRCLDDPAGAAPHCRQALTGLDYMFGRNSRQFVYVSGFGGERSRQHSFHHWLAALDATPFLFPGAIAGGPNEHPEPNDGSRPLAWPRAIWGYWDDPAMPRSTATPVDARYTDNDSWSTNELTVGWQAVALYNLYFAQWWASNHP